MVDRPPAPPAALREAADKLVGVPADSHRTALASYCMSSIIPAIQMQKGQLLRDILKRAALERQAAARDAKGKYLEAFRALSDAMTAPNKDVDKPKPTTPSRQGEAISLHATMPVTATPHPGPGRPVSSGKARRPRL